MEGREHEVQKEACHHRSDAPPHDTRPNAPMRLHDMRSMMPCCIDQCPKRALCQRLCAHHHGQWFDYLMDDVDAKDRRAAFVLLPGGATDDPGTM